MDKLIKNLKEHVYTLSHEIGDRNIFVYKRLEKSVEYIAEQFISFGYNVKFQSYSVENKVVKNIIANKRGISPSDKIIVVGAHYDTCFNPGGDDNSSGVAGLLELARILSCHPTDFSIKFVTFVNEEPPFFKTEKMGSRVFARSAKLKGEKIIGAIIFEMIGYYSDQPNSQQYPFFYPKHLPDRGNFIALVGNLSSRNFVKKIATAFRRYSTFPMETITGFGFLGIDFSDHWSFWKEGYCAVMVTDTAFYRNPNYHTYSDTYETLNYENMGEVVKGFKQVIVALTRDEEKK